MTAQIPDELVIEHARLEIGEWRLRSVIRGEPTVENDGWGDGEVIPIADIWGSNHSLVSERKKASVEVYGRAPTAERIEYTKPLTISEQAHFRHRPTIESTGNWKGYIRVFRLTQDGRLVLAQIRFDHDPRAPEVVNRAISGDFFMMLEARSRSLVYVRFREGTLVTDRSEWFYVPARRPPFRGPLKLHRGCPSDFPSSRA